MAIDDVLSQIARQVMALDEDCLTALLPRYRERMNAFAPTREWEESVVIYFLINGLRVKNTQFHDKMEEYKKAAAEGDPAAKKIIRPRLRLVKAKKTAPEAEKSAAPDKTHKDE
jgi:hypothetical protein